jgi:methionyl-tRNA synthetase
MTAKNKYLVTSALPYANGPIHFGHIAGVYLPADIYTRHRRLRGQEVIHVCGSDEHGVAIMMNAQKAKIGYQDYVNKWHSEHKNLFQKYNITFDVFGQTSADYHREETLKWFDVLYKKGLIEKRDERQLQCQDCHNYLPDRFVEGTCYVCGHTEARGDECPNCGTWIDPLKLINPVCQFCKSKNIETKNTFQYHLLLTKMHKEFRQWFETKQDWRKTVYSFVDSLSKSELVDRAITRDLDWGIDVPLAEAKGKKLYVWFDAPIGYVSNTKKLMQERGRGEDYLKDWWNNPAVEISHFIGKDNIIFHAIIFPVMSMGAGFIRTPDKLPANQYVNLEGKQFSKSKGWYVDADEAITDFGEDAMRYYLISLIPESSDSSFTWSGFEAKINGELANNIGNFVNRSMKFYFKNFAEGINQEVFNKFFASAEFKKLQTDIEEVKTLLDDFQIKRAMEKVMFVGMDANTFFSDRAPWKQIKEDVKECEYTLAGSLVYAVALSTLFAPFLPKLSSEILSYFFQENQTEILRKVYNNNISQVILAMGERIQLKTEPQGLVPKIEAEKIKALQEKLTKLSATIA